jgi:integrase
MARTRKDGMPVRPKRKRVLTQFYLDKKLEPGLHWDSKQQGLALRVRDSGHRSWQVVYSFHGRVRWYNLANAAAIGLAQARELAQEKMFEVAKGKDPQAERRSLRSAGSFEDLAKCYLEHAKNKKKNRSWRQADSLVQRHLSPAWGKRPAAHISREDVENVLRSIKSPSVANAVLAAASAIFSWALNQKVGGVQVHPCKGVERHETASRERVLFESEVPRFWNAFSKVAGPAGTALKLILLLGQRPGEISHMRAEHIDGGWWTLPGKPDPTLGWPGTKNGESHRVWLSEPVQALLADLPRTGFILADRNGRTNLRLPDVMRAICNDLGITNRVTPHDCRRSFATTVAALGFGRAAVDRILNHRDGGVVSIYDRHGYAEEDRRIMEAVASHLIGLATC